MPPTFTPIPVHPVTGIRMTGGQLTVPAMLQQPSRINSSLAAVINESLSLPNLISLFFTGGGGLSGGAVVYDKIPTQLDLNAAGMRQAEEVSPAAEFPLVSWQLAAEEQMARVRKYGGKYYVADEVRDRNDVAAVQLLNMFLAYSIQAKLNAAALALVDAELAAANMTATVSNWSTYDPTTMPVSKSPLADINEMQSRAPIGVSYDTLVLGTVDSIILRNSIANMAFVGQSLPGGGALPSIVELEQLTPGNGYFVDRGALGQVRYEQGLRTVTWREEETERTWVQSGVRPLFFVNQPGAALDLTIPGSGAWTGNVTFGSGVPMGLLMSGQSINETLGQSPESYSVNDVPDGSPQEITQWVGDDPQKAQVALEKEQASGQPRQKLVTQLQQVQTKQVQGPSE